MSADHLKPEAKPRLRSDESTPIHEEALMTLMHAAVVTSFEDPPHYEEFDVPVPGENQVLVDVLAVGLHPRVRSGVAGRHYASTGRLPLIPGVDGVGQMADGTRGLLRCRRRAARPHGRESPRGHACRMVRLSQGSDAVKVAAAMNPAMSSWLRRVAVCPSRTDRACWFSERPATPGRWPCGSRSGWEQGAWWVPGANIERLSALIDVGADETVQLSEDTEATARAPGTAAAEVDVVLDYLWGEPAEKAIMALLRARSDRSRELDWIQIGAMAGPRLELPSVALRSANLRIQGVGQGAISARSYLAELPSLIEEIDSGALDVTVRPVPLREIEGVWTETGMPGERIVVVP